MSGSSQCGQEERRVREKGCGDDRKRGVDTWPLGVEGWEGWQPVIQLQPGTGLKSWLPSRQETLGTIPSTAKAQSPDEQVAESLTRGALNLEVYQ